jgi:asparagine synthase (glutamine-hydrolysing)
MSGGIDSPMLAATAARLGSDRGVALRAYTATVERLYADDEGAFATLAARHIGLDHRIIDGSDDQWFDDFDTHIAEWAEPVDNPGLAHFRNWQSMVAGFARVVFEGEDGDALLAPASLRQQLRYFRRTDVAIDWIHFLFARRTVPYTGFRLRERVSGRPRYVAPPFPEWIKPELVKRLGLRERHESYWGEVPDESVMPVTSRLTNPYWQIYMERQDAGVAAVPVEVRLPLLDLRLIRFSLSLPSLPWHHRKELFRRAMASRLPPALLTRPKTPARELLPSQARRFRTKDRRESLNEVVASFVDLAQIPDPCAISSPSILWNALRPRLLARWMQTR